MYCWHRLGRCGYTERSEVLAKPKFIVRSVYSSPVVQKEITIRIKPAELNNDAEHRSLISRQLGISPSRIFHASLTHRTIDARHGEPNYLLRYHVWVDEAPAPDESFSLKLKDVRDAEPVLIVGSGPAGLFAALRLIELGLRPIILERGKPVRERRKDVAAISKGGIVDPDSNYCFGEGGAGTFSDGKLYTRSTKRGSKERILNIFTAYGADTNILVDAHPHIGTNKLPAIIDALTKQICEAGGEVHFGERVTDLLHKDKQVTGVATARNTRYEARTVVFATGHSARDIVLMLSREGVLLESKPFALGVRVEHPQAFVDELQYGSRTRHPNLPAASYALRAQSVGRGVFSFCMCPGGIICPAATSPGEVVVNGWSPSKRNSRFANSGIVVEITEEDLREFADDPVFAGIMLQQKVEQRAYQIGGGGLKAPAERLDCFVDRNSSPSLPDCSYNPGVQAASLAEVLPSGICERLREAFRTFEKSRPRFVTNEAIVVATESRTSSPVRVPRDKITLMHPELDGLFPCGEGAGYAGGIMSAAMDGERAADAVAAFLNKVKLGSK